MAVPGREDCVSKVPLVGLEVFTNVNCSLLCPADTVRLQAFVDGAGEPTCCGLVMVAIAA